jgi:hypothetical protein
MHYIVLIALLMICPQITCTFLRTHAVADLEAPLLPLPKIYKVMLVKLKIRDLRWLKV